MAEVYNPFTAREVIPEFRSDIFVGHENARFAVGRIAMGNETAYPTENLAYHQLRANVYGRAGFIPQDTISKYDGSEYDEDDARSIHMAILENRGDAQRLIASMRLIKRDGDRPLPIEELFPDAFLDNPVSDTSCEVSRYITRHEDRSVQDKASWTLFQQGLAEAMIHELSPAFAVVSPALSRIFRSRRLPIKELSSPVWIEKYGEENVPIAIDVAELAKRLEAQTPGALDKLVANQGGFTYFGERVSHIEVATLGEAALRAAGD
jgi:N-acyl-L-homoserine lactone synthetase